MNQVFTIDSGDASLNGIIQNDFIKESIQDGFQGLAGHRAVGGLRSTMYNSLKMQSCLALKDFMTEFLEKDY